MRGEQLSLADNFFREQQERLHAGYHIRDWDHFDTLNEKVKTISF